MDDASSGEAEPDTGCEILVASILTTSQSKPTSPLLDYGTWGMGRGRGIR